MRRDTAELNLDNNERNNRSMTPLSGLIKNQDVLLEPMTAATDWLASIEIDALAQFSAVVHG
jgi:hypothetical protein